MNILRWEYGSVMLFKYFKLILNLSFENKVDGVRYNHSIFYGRLIIQQNNWWMCIGWDWLLIGTNTFTVSFDCFLEISNCVFTCFFFLSAGTCPQAAGSPTETTFTLLKSEVVRPRGKQWRHPSA